MQPTLLFFAFTALALTDSSPTDDITIPDITQFFGGPTDFPIADTSSLFLSFKEITIPGNSATTGLTGVLNSVPTSVPSGMPTIPIPSNLAFTSMCTNGVCSSISPPQIPATVSPAPSSSTHSAGAPVALGVRASGGMAVWMLGLLAAALGYWA